METSNEKLRVAEIIGRYDAAGVDHVVMNYCRLIADDEMQIDVFYNEDSRVAPPTGTKNIRFIQIPAYKHFPAYMRALDQAFRRNGYQIVHAHVNTLSVFPLMAARRCRIPVRIAHSHSMAAKGETKRNLAKYLLRPFSKVNATQLMACSEQAGAWLFGDKAMASGCVTLLPNAVPTGEYAFSQAVRDQLRRELGWENDFVVGHVGRIISQKNHEFLLRIFAAFKKRMPSAKLLLVGDGPLREETTEQAKALGILPDVHFTGVVTDAAPYYQAMDCLVLPSRYEGLPLTVVEAQIAGLPVLASCAVPPEAFFTDGNQRMTLEESPDEWADALVQLAILSCSRDRHDGVHSAVQSGFDVQTEAQRLGRYYRGCVRNESVGSASADQPHHPGL